MLFLGALPKLRKASSCIPVRLTVCLSKWNNSTPNGQMFITFWYLSIFRISWCVFVRASLHMRREEKPTRYPWMLYCTYDMLNTFRAFLCPSTGARDYMCVITANGVHYLVAGCRGSDAGQQAVRPVGGMLHDAVVNIVLSSWCWA